MYSKARYSWNEKISQADKDLDVMRRLICPERESTRNVEGLALGLEDRDVCQYKVTLAQHLLEDVERLIAGGEDSDEQENTRGYDAHAHESRKHFQENARRCQSPHPMRDLSKEPSERFERSLRLTPNGFTCSETLKDGLSKKVPVIDKSKDFSKPAPLPLWSESRSDDENLLLQPKVPLLSFPTVANENTPTGKGFFLKLPEVPQDPENDAGDRQTKPVRVSTREVLKRIYSHPKARTLASKRHAVSKQPQLSTIAEEKEGKVPAKLTLSTNVGPPKDFRPIKHHQPRDSMKLAFNAEVKQTYQKPPTVNVRKDLCTPGRNGNEARARQACDIRVAPCRFGSRPRVEVKPEVRTRADVETETVEVDPRQKIDYETSDSDTTIVNSPVTKEVSTFDVNSSAVEEDREQIEVVVRDVRITDEDKVAERCASTNDVSQPRRSPPSVSRCETSAGTKPNAFPLQNSSVLENMAIGGDKLSYYQELAVLLWFCDFSDQLEQRSRASVNRMRAMVSMGDATLFKLRLLKDSLLNAKVVGGVGLNLGIGRQSRG